MQQHGCPQTGQNSMQQHGFKYFARRLPRQKIMHNYPVGKDLGYCMFQMSGVDSSEDWSGSEEEEGDEEEEDTDVSWETEGEESADTEEEPEEESKKNSP